MKYLIVSGSSRPNNQSSRIAAWMERELQAQGDETVVLDLEHVWMPESDPSTLWDKNSEETHKFQPTKHYLEWCDGVVVVCPEWDGMLPGRIINFFHCVGKSLAYKPALIVTNSNRMGGAFPEVILRGFASKNTRILWLPEHLIVRENETKFMDEPKDNADIYIQKRARFCLRMLRLATEKWTPSRPELLDILKEFPNGM